MEKGNYQIRYAAGRYWLLDINQNGLDYKPPMSVNETGMYIYTRLCDKKDVLHIAEEMHNDFGISIADAKKDIEDFIVIMTKKGILREAR